MQAGTVTQKLTFLCAFLPLLFFPRPARSASHTCGNSGTELCVLTADINGSRPPNSSMPNAPVEKGKRTGLFLHFSCLGAVTVTGQKDVCYPIINSGATKVQVKVGSLPAIQCGTAPGAPNTCSYSLVNVRGTSTCGPPPANLACTDTVKIVFNGVFPKVTTIQYSVGTMPGVDGVIGAGGEIENFADLVSFVTTGDTPSTVSLELVFDISGSMALPAVPGGSTTRIDALKQSAQVLYGILNSYALPGDKLGAVFFSTAANPNATPASPTPCSGLASTNLLGADDPANVTTVTALVNGQGPTASTSIGAGLQSAACGFLREASPQNAHRQIFLFSDGEQNTAPNVQVAGTTIQVTDNSGANPVSYPSNSATLCTAGMVPCIRICPVTAGRLAAPGFTLQQNIANAVCNGNNAHIRDASPGSNPDTFVQADLETYFSQSLTTIVTSDKLEMVADTIGTVSQGSSAIEKFMAASNDVRMTIVLSWSGNKGDDRNLTFQLKAPDGTIVDVTPLTSFGHNVSFTTVPFPLYQAGAQVGQGGEWQTAIDGTSLQSPSTRYHLLVMGDNPTLASEFAIKAQDIGTGEPIPLQVNLVDDGAPVLNATVSAQLMGPSNSQGNLLSNTPTRGQSNPGPDPASTKGQAKLDALYNDPANAGLFADNSLPTITLLDSGGTGVYRGSFTDTRNEGHYYFTIRVRGKSKTAGNFERTYWIARWVRSKPDPGNTVFKIRSSDVQANGTVLVTLQAIPHDALGNFLGPGYEKDMQIKSSEGVVENALDDKVDGSYEITFRLPSTSSNPTFTLQIMGTPVITKTLRQLRGSSSRFALFFAAGGAVPIGSLAGSVSSGFSLNGGLEYIVTNHFSTEAIVGYHHFPGTTTHLNVYQFSVNGTIYPTTGTLRPYINGGVGGYKLSPGSTTPGGNLGAGLLYDLSSRIGVDGQYNYHIVNTAGGTTRFSSVQGGIRFVF